MRLWWPAFCAYGFYCDSACDSEAFWVRFAAAFRRRACRGLLRLGGRFCLRRCPEKGFGGENLL